jgi:hypothetical protein
VLQSDPSFQGIVEPAGSTLVTEGKKHEDLFAPV